MQVSPKICVNLLETAPNLAKLLAEGVLRSRGARALPAAGLHGRGRGRTASAVFSPGSKFAEHQRAARAGDDARVREACGGPQPLLARLEAVRRGRAARSTPASRGCAPRTARAALEGAPRGARRRAAVPAGARAPHPRAVRPRQRERARG